MARRGATLFVRRTAMSDFRDEFQIQASASKLEKTRSAWFRWHVDAPQLSEGHGMFPEGSSESLRHVPPAGFAVSMGPAPSRSVSLSLTHAMPPIRSGSVASINSVGDV